MILKKLMLPIIILALSFCLFFTVGFEDEIEYEVEFLQSEYATIVGDIVDNINDIKAKLAEFRSVLVTAKTEDPNAAAGLDSAIAEIDALVALLDGKIADFNANVFEVEKIKAEIIAEWEKEGVKQEAGVEVELEVQNEEGIVEVEIEYEGELGESDGESSVESDGESDGESSVESDGESDGESS